MRTRAMELRAEGKTYAEIQRILGRRIPKSTLSYWCKDVVLPFYYQKKVQELVRKGSSRGRARAIIANQEKYERIRSEVRRKSLRYAKSIQNQDVARIALAVLYLGEGAKWPSFRGLALGSSDPYIVRLYINLLNRCYAIPRERMRARIVYRADQDIQALQRFWAKETGFNDSQFYKTIPDYRSKGVRTRKNEYKGVCTIYCAGTEIQLELDGIARSLLG